MATATEAKKTVCHYEYHSEQGELRFRIVRFEPKDFRPQHIDAHANRWAWGMGDVEPILYRLPELISYPTDRYVFVVEGEKDCESLRTLGMCATTNPGGAGKWRADYNRYFVGRKVVVLGDHDAVNPKTGKRPGREHAVDVIGHLGPVVDSLRAILELPGVPENGGDVSDWIAAGGTKKQLADLAMASDELALRALAKADRQPKPAPAEEPPAVPSEPQDSAVDEAAGPTDPPAEILDTRGLYRTEIIKRLSEAESLSHAEWCLLAENQIAMFRSAVAVDLICVLERQPAQQ